MSDESQNETEQETAETEQAAPEEQQEGESAPAAKSEHVAKPKPAAKEPEPSSSPTHTPTAAERFRNAVGAPTAGDDQEIEIWEGGYSPKAMVGNWVVCGAVTVAVIALLIYVAWFQQFWLWLIGATALVWVYFGLLLTYRKMSVHYRLTNQRFFHERGVLWRRTDRIEVIDMDDISYEQGPFERIFGVGTIKIDSSDKSHPQLVLPGIARVREIAGKIDQARRTERVRRGLHIANI